MIVYGPCGQNDLMALSNRQLRSLHCANCEWVLKPFMVLVANKGNDTKIRRGTSVCNIFHSLFLICPFSFF